LVGYTFQPLAMAGWSSHAWLEEISQPTLVLAAAMDRAAPLPNSEVLARRIPGARLEVFPRGGHLFLLGDDVGPVAVVIDDFLQSAGRAGPAVLADRAFASS
jgi:pimeloyl-ACP methyl ester carboxylesterase